MKPPESRSSNLGGTIYGTTRTITNNTRNHIGNAKTKMLKIGTPNSHIRQTPITKLRTESTRAYIGATCSFAPQQMH